MAYRIQLAPNAERGLSRLPAEMRPRLRTAIQALGENPRPHGARKVVGRDRTWRVRVGSYRIVYEVYEDNQLVVIGLVGRRSEGTYRI